MAEAETIFDLHEEYPEHALIIPLDVTVQEEVDKAVRMTILLVGRIMGFSNNAGDSYRSVVEEGEEESVRWKVYLTD